MSTDAAREEARRIVEAWEHRHSVSHLCDKHCRGGDLIDAIAAALGEKDREQIREAVAGALEEQAVWEDNAQATAQDRAADFRSRLDSELAHMAAAVHGDTAQRLFTRAAAIRRGEG